jgi:hypothetical protein
MTKWFDLGMSHPLALGMAHPLADRLETLGSPKVNKFWAKGTTAAFVLGVAALSAPLTIAESHPENTLEDTVVTTHDKKSVIKIHKTDDDGNEIKKHYEIELKGDEFEAYEFDEDGNKRKVEASEIEGFNLEDAKNSKSWAFSIGEDNQLKFDSGKHISSGAKGEVRLLRFPDKGGMKKVFRLEGLKELSNLEELEKLSELESLDEVEKLKVLETIKKIEGLESLERLETELSDVFVWNGDMPEPPEPPLPPGYKNEDGDVSVTRSFVFSDSKLLDGEMPLRFKMGKKDGYVLFNEEGQMAEAKLAAAKSMLETVESMLENVDGSKESEQELKQARKDLTKARKALEDARLRIKNTEKASE